MEAVSLENELQVWNLLECVAKIALSQYPTTINEDKELVEEYEQKKHLSFNHINCIKFIITEKKILHNFILCKIQINQLAKLTCEQALKEIELWDCIKTNNNSEYLKTVVCPLLPKGNIKKEE